MGGFRRCLKPRDPVAQGAGEHSLGACWRVCQTSVCSSSGPWRPQRGMCQGPGSGCCSWMVLAVCGLVSGSLGAFYGTCHIAAGKGQPLVRVAQAHVQLVLGIQLCNVFISDLEKAPACTLVKFADDALLGGPVDRFEDRAAIQSDPDKLEEWVDRNPMKFSRASANSCVWEGI